MQHQLLGNKIYNDVSMSQNGIELNTLNDTSVIDSKSTSRQGYISLDDVQDNVVYAEKNIKNDYVPLPNGQTQQQQLLQKQQQQQQQQQFYQSGFMPQSNYPGLINGKAPVIPQQGISGSQMPQQQTQSYCFVQPNPSSIYATNNCGSNPYNQAMLSSQFQFGMGNISDHEMQQQIQLQQKILDDISKSKGNQNQPQQSQKPVSQQTQQTQASQNKNQIQSQQQQPPGLKAPSQPQQQQTTVVGKMEVKCASCTILQRIPICSKKFQCYNCCTVQEAISQMPVYSMFLCGNCQARVLFEPGKSDFIQCTRCQIVNKIGETKQQDKQKTNSNTPNSRTNSQNLITDIQKPPILRSPVLQPQQQQPQSTFQQPPQQLQQQQQYPSFQQTQQLPQQQPKQLYPSLLSEPKQQQQQQQQPQVNQKEVDDITLIEKEFENMLASSDGDKVKSSTQHTDQLEALKKEKEELQKQLDQHKELIQNQSTYITQAQQQIQQSVLLQQQQQAYVQQQQQLQQQQQQQLQPPQNNYNYPPQSSQQVQGSIMYTSELPAQGQAVSSYGVTSVYQGGQMISNTQL